MGAYRYSTIHRYKDGYHVAQKTDMIGNAIKVLASAIFWIGVILVISLLFSQAAGMIGVQLIIWALGLFVTGLILSAIGCGLAAVQDTAIYNSPFLSNAEKALAMNLMRDDTVPRFSSTADDDTGASAEQK